MESSELLKKDELISLFKRETVNIEFTKNDGTTRAMKCTLMPEMLPVQIELEELVNTRKGNPDILAVFDLDKSEWRSFRWDRLLSVNGVKID
jgi:hypothetical protein